MRTDPDPGRITRPPFGGRNESAQALAELTVGLVAFAVAFLALLLVADMSRARMSTLLESRKEAGENAISGLLTGSPVFYGNSADPASRLQTEVMAPLEDPISYSKYSIPNDPYMKNNLVSPLYNPNGTLIAPFNLTIGEETMFVTNAEFLVNMGVGQPRMKVTQQTCLPILKGFQ